jgi:plasmid stabilization system protein ParE
VKPIRVHPEAQLEAEAAVQWYGQRSPHAAGRLVAELRSALERIQQGPNQFPKLALKARRKVLGRFPYLVVFRETATEIEIVAVAHGRRRPGYWRERLSSTSH